MSQENTFTRNTLLRQIEAAPTRLGLRDHSAPRFTALETEAAQELIALSQILTGQAESALTEGRLWNKSALIETLRTLNLSTSILCRRLDHPIRENGIATPFGQQARG